MSALPPKADIRQRIEHVCFVPIADARQVTGKYFVGLGQEASLGPGRIGRNPKAISPLTPVKGNNSP